MLASRLLGTITVFFVTLTFGGIGHVATTTYTDRALFDNAIAGWNSTTVNFVGMNAGDLIVGYDEPRTEESNKEGSHNIVVGRLHNYPSYGGPVAGSSNEIGGPYASV